MLSLQNVQYVAGFLFLFMGLFVLSFPQEGLKKVEVVLRDVSGIGFLVWALFVFISTIKHDDIYDFFILMVGGFSAHMVMFIWSLPSESLSDSQLSLRMISSLGFLVLAVVLLKSIF